MLILSASKLPAQCTDGSQNACSCETADVLCTIDELDGYTFEMDPFLHPSDGPSPLCPGPGCSCVPNNPTWFAFVAWCEEIDLEVLFTNCTAGSGTSIGVQVAIYSSCGPDYDVVDCDVSAADCATTDPKELFLTGLTIGDIYYFVVDGCSGSYCDIEVNVIGTCGEAEIEEWSNDIQGDLIFCVGEEETYIVDNLDGANVFHWYIDGVEVDLTDFNFYDITWDEAGEFELCVDASNDPCVPVTNDPEPICVTITVFDPEIEDWMNPIDGPISLCAGDNGLYTVDQLEGAADFHWYLDGVEIDVTDENFLDIFWGMEGMFELCVDASNEPCVSVGDDPDQICLEITVFDPEAGDIFADPEELCPGEFSTITITGYTEEAGVETSILVTDDDGDIVDILPPPSTMVTYEDCENITVCSYTYSSNSPPVVGQNVSDIDCGTDCCDIECMVIDFSDDDTPDFLDTPDDITISCFDDLPPMEDLEFTDNCIEDGFTVGEETITADICFGGTVDRTWSQSDGCENTRTYTQTINIDPIPEAVFDMLPADETVGCINIPSSFPDLNYSNGMTTSCVIAGVASPNVVEEYEPMCGGTITVTWMYMDLCDRLLSHEQVITIEPSLEPSFIDPPGDMSFDCTMDDLTPGPLSYENGDPDCPISGSVDPDIVENVTDLCGGTITATWTFTDDCDRTITHTQVITIAPALDPQFIDPPQNETVPCTMDDLTPGPLSYTNSDSNCLIEGVADPTVVEDYTPGCGGTITTTWEFDSVCDGIIQHTQVITIEPAPEATFDDLPADVILACADQGVSSMPLNYSNGDLVCPIEGSADAVVDGTIDPICGGEVNVTWMVLDDCDREISHTQNIIVDPAPQAAFINPPQDMTLTCSAQEVIIEDLMYTNGDAICSIEGVAQPDVVDDADACGGTITITWEFTDACDRMITHTQVITIEPALPPVFSDLPADQNLLCSDPDPTFDDLTYTNMDIGSCLLSGTVSPDVIDDTDECGGTIMATWEFQDDCGQTISHTQTITVDPPPPPMFIDLPVNETVSCANIPTGAENLAYSNDEPNCTILGEVSPDVIEDYNVCGGTITYVWEFEDACDNSINHLQVLTIEPAPEAVFLSLPMNLSMSCADFANFTPDPLMYSNSATGICMIEGEVEAQQSGSFDLCGGIVELVYEFTDECDRTITHTQEITVEPAPMAAFDNLPENMTLPCNESNAPAPNLSYSNGAIGNCAIEGQVEAIMAGVADECGGVISYIWTFTDECSRTISHTQVVTYEPSAEPVWIDPPVDGQLDCDNLLPDDLSLEYDNGEDFPCLINGFEEPNIDETDEAFTLTWEYTNPCTNMTITHVQVYDKSIVVDWPEDYLEFSICETEVFDLSSIVLIDQNNTDPTITYHDGSPPDGSNEINSSLVNPNSPTTYYIFGNNEFNCPDVVEIFLDVETIFFAGSDNDGTICVEEETLDLYDYLSNDSDFSGDFFQIDGPSLNIGDPESINISTAEPGTYVFNYIIEGTDYCPEDIAVITIEIAPPIDVMVVEISCAPDFQTYIVEVTNNGYDIDINAGVFGIINFNSAIIENIPINTDLEITIEDGDTDCETAILVSPPNCDCPDVEAPISNGDFVICVGDPIPELSVNLMAQQTANWFDAPIGGTLLAGNTSSYTPTIMNAGVYTFYVESESLSDPGCTSDTRVPIQVEILTAPDYGDLMVSNCDTDQDGIIVWDDETLRDYIGYNQTETATYYVSQVDAENESNAIALPWSNNPAFSSTIYATIKNTAGCATVIRMDLIINPKPTLAVQIENESCDGAGDGSFIITNFDANNSYLLDGVQMTGQNETGLAATDYELILIDENGCGDTLRIDILPGTEISFESFTWNCNDSGTNTDPDDDFYEISFVVQSSVTSSGNMFEVSIGGVVQGAFTYGMANSIMLPADQSSPILVFTDIDNGCSLEQNIGPLNPCSTNCVLTAETLEYECNGNGTPTDPADDFYDVSILVNALNGSSINRYNVGVDGVITFSFEYGILSTFTLPATGSIVTISLIDAEDQACTLNESLGPLNPCSDACVVNAEAINIICDNNGTDDDNNDDVFYFDLSVMGLNTGPNYEISSLSIVEAFGTTTNLGPFNISDGTLTLEISDTDDPTCMTILMVTPPMACSDCNQTVELSMPGILSCSEPTATVTVTTSEQGIYSWTGPDGFTSTQSEITVGVPGIYDVLVSFFNGCTQTSSVEVFSDNNIPIALAGPDQAFTCLVSMVTLDASNSIYPTGANFEWTDADGVVLSTELTLDVTEVGLYYFLIIDPLTGCNSAVEEVAVTSETGGPSVVITSDPGNVLDCEVSMITLNSPQEANVSYTWTVNGNVATSEPIIITEASEVNLYAFNDETGCDNESNITVLDLMESPMIVMEPDGEIGCEGGEICIDASATPNAEDLEFSWSDQAGNTIGGNSATICVMDAGNYTLEVMDLSSGCINAQSISVEAPIVPEATLPGSLVILPGESGELTVDVNIPFNDIAEIIWSPAEFVSCQDCLTTTVINAPDGTVITAEVISVSGCRSLDETIIQSSVSVEVYIPNIFNPDSSTGNEGFTLYGNEQVLLIEEMYIYDRWGNMMFQAQQIEPNNLTLGWDGRFNNRVVEQGVYVYLFKVLYANTETEVFTGDITLLKN